MLLVVFLLSALAVLCAASSSVPTYPEWSAFSLNTTAISGFYPSLLSQYTGGTVVVASNTYIQQWHFHDAVTSLRQYVAGKSAVYGGRVWTMSPGVDEAYTFNVLDDQLNVANYVPVNTTVDWQQAAPFWQIAVDEDASLLYSAGMVDNSMQLHCWTFDINDNSSSLLYWVTLPTPYLPATLYPGAKHTLLLAYDDSTRIYRLNGYTGQVIGTFHAPDETPPTALVESADGTVLYISADWPNVAAFDIAANEVLAYFYYSGPWDQEVVNNKFVSLVISGDGEWMSGLAVVQNTPIMRWRIGSSHRVWAPHSSHFTTLATNITQENGVGISAQYTGATIVVQRYFQLTRWQLNNSIPLVRSSFQSFLATSYRGRVWTAAYGVGLVFSVLDDQLNVINSWDVNCTVFSPPVQFQMAVDEEAGLLYAAGMIDQTMQLYAFQINAVGNATSLAFMSKLPTPYLPANLYPGAHHTLLVTYQDDTHIYRICGWTGALLSVFNASTTVPTTVVESHDGRVLYVSYEWPSMAAYDSMTGELLMYYDYTEGWGKQARDTFVSASITGDGQWLFAFAATQALVVQWRINATSSSGGKGPSQMAPMPARATPSMTMSRD